MSTAPLNPTALTLLETVQKATFNEESGYSDLTLVQLYQKEYLAITELLHSEYHLDPRELQVIRQNEEQNQFLQHFNFNEHEKKDIHHYLDRLLHLSKAIDGEIKKIMKAKINESLLNTSNERADIAKKAEPLLTKTVSLASAIGKVVKDSVAPLFGVIAKSFISPLDYLFKGIMAIRDAITTPPTSQDPQRHLKIGTALLIAAASFAYVGVATAIAVNLLAGLAITAGTIAAAPIVLPVLLVTISGIGLFKEQRVLNQMENNIKKSEKQLENLKSLHDTKYSHTESNAHRFNIINCQITELQRKIQQDKSALNYQSRRSKTSLLTLIGYVTAACGLLFPPLFIVGAAMVVTAVSIDAVDKHLQRKAIEKETKTKATETVIENKTMVETFIDQKHRSALAANNEMTIMSSIVGDVDKTKKALASETRDEFYAHDPKSPAEPVDRSQKDDSQKDLTNDNNFAADEKEGSGEQDKDDTSFHP